MLKEVYQKHLNNRRPKIGKHELDAVFEERLLEIKNERTLDLIQVMAFGIGMLRDRNKRLSETIAKVYASVSYCPDCGYPRPKHKTWCKRANRRSTIEEGTQ